MHFLYVRELLYNSSMRSLVIGTVPAFGRIGLRGPSSVCPEGVPWKRPSKLEPRQ